MNEATIRREKRHLRHGPLELALDAEEAEVRPRVAHRLGVPESELLGFRITKKSLDARGRGRGRPPSFKVQVEFDLAGETSTPRIARLLRSGKLKEVEAPVTLDVERVRPESELAHAVVVGSGPAGLFAALVLARNGTRVTVVDRGAAIEERSQDVVGFHRSRQPNPESNLLFGEGGAGTYSDGKIYTRVDHPLELPILEELVACGAPESITYDSLAHIGTDRLHRILPALRERMRALGVEFVFGTRMDSLVLQEGNPRSVTAIATTQGEIACDALFLATGHSARDTWSELERLGVMFEAKPFQLGLRVEHPQEVIDAARWGDSELLRGLGAASYQLVCKSKPGELGAHTFCMCPGGKIVASVNEPGLLCTNGMSNSTHSSRWANSGVVTTFGPDDFAAYGEGPFAGVAFQRALEASFFEAGGSDYTAPAQRVVDFVRGEATRDTGASSYTFGTRPARLDRLLPEKGRAALVKGIATFERLMPGFAGPEGLLCGVESRSAGPVRMPRGTEDRLATGFSNLYPLGEGAGFAGGIMSAALDGARSAVQCLTSR
jgi:uncharacterized FAD-dependent dehydrogenase